MPVVRPDNTVQTAANKSLDLTAKKAGDLALATIHLFTNNRVPTPQSVLADFDVPTYTGYASQAIAAWTSNEIDGNGQVSTTATTVLSWVGPGDATGQTIYGYYVRSAGAGTPFIYAALFDQPIALAVPTDVLDLVVTFKLP